MAEAGILISEDEFCCSVCLDLLKDPVTLACGHSFCMSCITTCWDLQPGNYSCPQCRETFGTRPNLRRNNMLAGVVEKLRKTKPQIYAKFGDEVMCDICTGMKHKAVKFCLVCMASYCEDHFQTHKESSTLMKHIVTEASADLHKKICPLHGKLLEIFCHTDQKCICYLCTLDDHSDHNMVSLVAERTEIEKQVVEIQNNYTQRILERECDCLDLRESLVLLKNSAQVAVEDTEKMFHELIQSVEKKCHEVTNQIRAQEEVELNRTKEHLKQVEQEIVELRSKNEELMQLSQTQDDILYIQIFQAIHDLSLPETIPRINITMPHSFEDVKVFVHKLKEQIESTKLCPDSSPQVNSQNLQPPCHPEHSTISTSNSGSSSPKPASQSKFIFDFGASYKSATQSQKSQSTFATPSLQATRSQFISVFTSTPATQAQTIFRLPSTPASQSVFRQPSTPATQSQSVFRLPSTPSTQSQSVFRLPSTPATQSQSVFRLPSTPATQSQSVFRLPSTPASQSQSVFRLPSTPATQSQSVFRLPSTPATQSQSVFRLPSTPATQSQSVFRLPSTPATQSQSVFRLPSTPATQSQSVFRLPSTPATQSQSVFRLPSTPATQSQSVFRPPSTPATQPQSVFRLPSTTATQSQSVFRLPSTPASQSVFRLTSTPATQPQPVIRLPSTPAMPPQSVFRLPSTPVTQPESVFQLP